MGRLGRLAVLLAWVLLSACAELTTLPGSGPLDGTTRLGPPIEQFAVAGRLTLTTGERRDSLRFEWNHAATNDQIMLTSPLGQGVAELTRNTSGVRLLRATQPPLDADSLGQLAQKVFGAPLPLEHLADWLRGVHADPAGRVDDWEIRVTAVDAFAGSILPRRLDIRRGDIALGLVVDQRGGAE